MDVSEVARYWEANAPAWTAQSRAGHDIYRDALNTPAFLAMLPPVDGLSGIDIGCGEGSNTRKLAERGARISAIDLAPTFIRHARETEQADPLGINYQIADAADLPFEDAAFDFAVAFMSLMDVPDQEKALTEATRVLKPGGFLQFSILHPCFVPPTRRNIKDKDGNYSAVEVADYFASAPGEVETWQFSSLSDEEKAQSEPFRVPRFHRTLSEWVGMICATGLNIEAMGEPRADEQTARTFPTVADTRVAPIFLHVRARKPA